MMSKLPSIVLPAEAGTHLPAARTVGSSPRRGDDGEACAFRTMGPGFRRDDGRRVWSGLVVVAMAGLVLAACSPAEEAQAPNAEAIAAAPAAPKVSVATLDDMPPPLPLPYDDAATPESTKAAIDAAFQRASASDKRVIIDLGGNWCGWCRGLSGVMNLPEVKPFLDEHFEIVYVSVSSTQGATDKNLEVLERFGIAEIDGFPWLIVAEPDGTVLASSSEVTDENHETPQAMVDWLAQFARPREVVS